MLKSVRAAINAGRAAYKSSEDSADSQRPSIRSLCAASFRPVSRSIGRTIASFFNPHSIAHSIRCGHRKAISDLATADLPEPEAEKADRLRLEAETQSTLAEIGRDAWKTLQDLSKSESLARSWLNDIEGQLAKPAASLPSEGQKLLRQMQSNQKDYLAGCAESRKTIGTQVKRAIAAAPGLSLSTVIPFSSFFPPGSSQATSIGDSGKNTISLGGRG